MRSRYRFFYGAAAYLLVPVVAAVMLWRGWRERGYWKKYQKAYEEAIRATATIGPPRSMPFSDP